MKIVDAIRHADGEQSVYFLLTSYLESFWEGDQRESLDEPLRCLPIRGKADVLRRTRALESQGAHDSPIIAEAREIFRAASERLQAAPTDGACTLNNVHGDAVSHIHVSP